MQPFSTQHKTSSPADQYEIALGQKLISDFKTRKEPDRGRQTTIVLFTPCAVNWKRVRDNRKGKKKEKKARTASSSNDNIISTAP